MKVIGHGHPQDSEKRGRTFNNCEHLFVELEPGQNQTVSVKLPNGRFVTFCFIRKSKDSTEFECCDIHSTVGKEIELDNGRKFHKHVFVGFTVGHNTFDTRTMKEPTTLATLLLSPEHNA